MSLAPHDLACDRARWGAERARPFVAGFRVHARVLPLIAWAMLLPSARLTSQSSPATVSETSAGPIIRPGDAVRVTVWRKPELSGEFTVAADGTLAHPLFRRVVVTGVPIATVESRLNEVLKQYEASPQFVVEPLLRVAVGGEVRTPNLYNLRPEMSIGEALALAGGATERGRTDRVILFRDGRETMIRLRGSDQPAAIPIRSGDKIVVERSRSALRDVIGPTVVFLGSVAAMVNVFL